MDTNIFLIVPQLNRMTGIKENSNRCTAKSIAFEKNSFMSNFETLHTFPMSVTYIYVFNLPSDIFSVLPI